MDEWVTWLVLFPFMQKSFEHMSREYNGNKAGKENAFRTKSFQGLCFSCFTTHLSAVSLLCSDLPEQIKPRGEMYGL